MVHGWSETAVQTGANPALTGNWTPISVNPDGSLNVQVSGLAFSGSLEVNTDVLESINASGVRFQASVSGQLATATRSDLPSGYTPYTGMVNVNRAVVTSGYNPQFASGAPAVTAIDNINGGTLAVMSDLDQSTDSVTSYVPSATTTSNYVPSGAGAVGATIVTGNIFQANPNRVQSYIQVIGSGGALYVKFGDAPASTGSFSVLLKPSTTDFGTDGGVWSDNGFWKGSISVSGGLGTRFICWEA